MTELIAGYKHVTTPRGERVIVTTKSGATVWVPKNQFNEQVETITYTPMKAGDKYTSRTQKDETGAPLVLELKSDQNQFVGQGAQIIQKYSSMDLIDRVLAAGKTPSFNLAN